MSSSLFRLRLLVGYGSLVCLAIAVTLGCRPDLRVVRVDGTYASPRAIDAPVQVFRRGETVEQPYQILGKVFTERTYNPWETWDRDDDILSLLMERARELGAEALFDVHVLIGKGSYTSGLQLWAGGLAVNFRSKKDSLLPAGFVAAMPPVSGDFFGQHGLVQEFVQYEIEKKGYYGMPATDSIPFHGWPDVASPRLEACGAPYAQQLLLLDYRIPDDVQAGHVVSAVLIDKDGKRVVWRDSVRFEPGPEPKPGDVDVIYAPNVQDVRRGIKKLVSSLPILSGMERIAPSKRTTSWRSDE